MTFPIPPDAPRREDVTPCTLEELEDFSQRFYAITKGQLQGDVSPLTWPFIERLLVTALRASPATPKGSGEVASSAGHPARIPDDAELLDEFPPAVGIQRITPDDDPKCGIDEVVGEGSFHLERMDTGCLWVRLGGAVFTIHARGRVVFKQTETRDVLRSAQRDAVPPEVQSPAAPDGTPSPGEGNAATGTGPAAPDAPTDADVRRAIYDVFPHAPEENVDRWEPTFRDMLKRFAASSRNTSVETKPHSPRSAPSEDDVLQLNAIFAAREMPCGYDVEWPLLLRYAKAGMTATMALDHLSGFAHDGCCTGDCPHWTANECIAHLTTLANEASDVLSDYESRRARNTEAGRAPSSSGPQSAKARALVDEHSLQLAAVGAKRTGYRNLCLEHLQPFDDEGCDLCVDDRAARVSSSAPPENKHA